MKPTLLDTDILSYFFKGNTQIIAKVDAYLDVFPVLNISLITYYEILNGLYFKDAQRQLKIFESFISLHNILPLTEDIAKIAARTYADLKIKGQSIGHNDCLIAATALVNDLQLITNNIAHYSRIKGLDYENWIT